MERQKYISKQTSFFTELEDREISIKVFDIENSNLNETELEKQSEILDKQYVQFLAELKAKGYTEVVYKNDYATLLKTNDDTEFAFVSSKDTSVISCKL